MLFFVLFSWQAQLLSRPSHPRPFSKPTRAGVRGMGDCKGPDSQIEKHATMSKCEVMSPRLLLVLCQVGCKHAHLVQVRWWNRANKDAGKVCIGMSVHEPEAGSGPCENLNLECQRYLSQHGSTQKRWFDLILDLVKESARHKVFESLQTCLVGTADSLQMLLSKACGLGRWKCKSKI